MSDVNYTSEAVDWLYANADDLSGKAPEDMVEEAINHVNSVHGVGQYDYEELVAVAETL